MVEDALDDGGAFQVERRKSRLMVRTITGFALHQYRALANLVPHKGAVENHLPQWTLV